MQAREREAGERAKAEAAQTAAETSRSQAMDALQKAEESFAKSRAAVNDYLTAVSDDPRLKAPGLSPLRAQLLQSALGFYQQFLRERGSDPTLRKELAAVYYKVGTIFGGSGAATAGQDSPSRSPCGSTRPWPPRHRTIPRSRTALPGPCLRRREEPRAIAIWEKLVRPDDPRYQADLGYAYNDVGLRAGEGGDRAKELEFLRKALLIRERLVQLRPDDPEARVGLSASLNNIAIRLKVERNAEKLALLRRAGRAMRGRLSASPRRLARPAIPGDPARQPGVLRQAGRGDRGGTRRPASSWSRCSTAGRATTRRSRDSTPRSCRAIQRPRRCPARRPADWTKRAGRRAGARADRRDDRGDDRVLQEGLALSTSLRIPSPWPDPRPRRRGPERRARGGGGGQGSAAARPRRMARPATGCGRTRGPNHSASGPTSRSCWPGWTSWARPTPRSRTRRHAAGQAGRSADDPRRRSRPWPDRCLPPVSSAATWPRPGKTWPRPCSMPARSRRRGSAFDEALAERQKLSPRPRPTSRSGST